MNGYNEVLVDCYIDMNSEMYSSISQRDNSHEDDRELMARTSNISVPLPAEV